MNYGMPQAPGATPQGQPPTSYVDPYKQTPTGAQPAGVGMSGPNPISGLQGSTPTNMNQTWQSADNAGVVYGGVHNGANNYAAGALAAGQALYGRSGPQVNTAPGDAYGKNFGALQQGAQSDALNLAGQTARGQGAAIQASDAAVQGQFNANLGQQINAGQAMANSARGGGPGMAAAQANAQQGVVQQSTASAQNAGNAAASARAGLMSNAAQQYGQQGLAMGQQSLAAQQEQYKLAMGQSGLDMQQGAMNQQGLLAEQGMGQQAQLAQLGAEQGVYANNQGLAGTAMQVGAQQTQAGIGAGGAVGGALIAGMLTA